MIFYDINNTSILRYSQIQKDPRLICKIPWSKKDCLKRKQKLEEDYQNLKVGSEPNVEDITEEKFSTSLYCRILIFEVLSKSLFIGETKDAKELYKHYFKKDYKKEDHAGIMKRANRLKLSYEASVEEEAVKEPDFDAYIFRLEKILIDKVSDIWGKMLYQLPMYEELALSLIQKIQEDERVK